MSSRLQPNVHVIAVDDEPHILKLIEASLKDNYIVTTFLEPDEALQALHKGLKPDLIISDVTMPEMTGFDMHVHIRESASLRSVPFIYLTAHDDRDTFRKGMMHGADDYLTKPFKPSELRDAISVRLARAGLLRDTPEQLSLNIMSLGGVGLNINQQRLVWEAKKVVELLLYLIVTGDEATLDGTRKDLWSEKVSGNNLHVLINRLRKTVGEHAQVVVEDDRIRLALELPFIWDARLFQKAAEKALAQPDDSTVEAAILRYRGEFLPGFDSPWANWQRSQFETLYADLLQTSINLAPSEAIQAKLQARYDAFLGIMS